MEREGVVYKLRGKGKYFYTYYIGSTSNFKSRILCHKNINNNETSSKIFNGEFTYEILEKVKYTDKKELLKREQYHLNNTIGCINKMPAYSDLKPYTQKFIKNEAKILKTKRYIIDSKKVMEFIRENYVLINKSDKDYLKNRIVSTYLYYSFIDSYRSSKMKFCHFRLVLNKLNIEEYKFSGIINFVGIKAI